MISNELLSEVLNREVSSLQIAGNPNDIAVGFADGASYSSFDLCINIHELAFKCKEWAYDNTAYEITAYRMQDTSEYRCVIGLNLLSKYKDVIGFYADSEPEAIFKACEWIRENAK